MCTSTSPAHQVLFSWGLSGTRALKTWQRQCPHPSYLTSPESAVDSSVPQGYVLPAEMTSKGLKWLQLCQVFLHEKLDRPEFYLPVPHSAWPFTDAGQSLFHPVRHVKLAG